MEKKTLDDILVFCSEKRPSNARTILTEAYQGPHKRLSDKHRFTVDSVCRNCGSEFTFKMLEPLEGVKVYSCQHCFTIFFDGATAENMPVLSEWARNKFPDKCEMKEI